MTITYLIDGGYLNEQLYLEDSQTQVGYLEGPDARLAVFASETQGFITRSIFFGTQARYVLDFSRHVPSEVEQIISQPMVLPSEVQILNTQQLTLASEVQGQITVQDEIASESHQFISRDAILGTEVGIVNTQPLTLGSEVEGQITIEETLASESHQVITQSELLGSETEQIITKDIIFPSQSLLEITVQQLLATQAHQFITQGLFLATEAESIRVARLATEVRYALYNTNRLRFMCEFPTRGVSGTNWTATSVEPGHFSPNNLNTDIVEEYYRSATGVTSVSITCDTELAQGIFNDTTALLEHNLTRGAQITMLGTNDPSFVTIPFAQDLTWSLRNIYYIAPSLPTESYRYWRFQITDTSNPDGFIRIGAIVAGTSNIFAGECNTDQIVYGRRQFVDQVFTEGHTNVQNDRGQKRYMNLEFRDLNAGGRNFGLLESLFEVYGTTHKCLWIAVPEDPPRFAVFAKLSSLPQQTHNYKGAADDYVDLTIELDESL